MSLCNSGETPVLFNGSRGDSKPMINIDIPLLIAASIPLGIQITRWILRRFNH